MGIELKPLSVFRLGERKVIQCRVIRGRPQDALNQTLVYRDDERSVSLVVTGLSTAWGKEGIVDLSFEGPLEPPLAISPNALLASS